MNLLLLAVALLLILVSLVIGYYRSGTTAAPAQESANSRSKPGPASARETFLLDGAGAPKLLSAEEVDPMITGGRYANAGNMREVYTQRTAHGLKEFASASGAPGDSGVDTGPWGLYEYGNRDTSTDDGIPEAWNFPSTPFRWYKPKMRDYLGPGGPVAYSKNLYAMTVPDHVPYMN